MVKNNYLSFDVIKKLYFVRTCGSIAEDKAGDILIDECASIGVKAHKEEFEVDAYEEISSSLSFEEPNLSFNCVCVGLSSSTPEDGIRGEFTYVNSLEDVLIQNVTNKICLVHSKICNVKIYQKLCEKKASGLILCTGSVYKDNSEIDLDPYMYREKHYVNGKIPAVCISLRDADQIIKTMPKFAKIKVIQNEKKAKSHNIVATINGKDFKDEIICFSAHYDSVSYSKGAYDNATGSACLFQILAYFKKHKPSRTLKFIWCGGEENGLLGSKAYCKDHLDELKNYKLNINVDMLAVTLGHDIACCTSDMSLVNYLKYLSFIEGFPLEVRQGVYSSDSTSFADKKVPSLSFARLSPQGGATIHSHDDVMTYLSEDNYYRSCDFIIKFASNLINAKYFPVEKELPQNVIDDIDVYCGRKEKNK